MASASPIESFRAGLDPQVLAIVDALRSLISQAHDELVEELKWNAPSFRHGPDHKVTLGLEKKGGVRVVLHRGAKPKDGPDFRFHDLDGLARWLAPDRGVLVFHGAEEVMAKGDALRALVRRWVIETA